MKKEGYKPHVAAAVEALASTGGQIMPPVMGAAAFIMAEIIGQPYKNIMKAAIIPAILYFLAVYVIVHLTALKGKIDYSEEKAKSDKQPILAVIKEGWYYVIPIAVLIYLLLQGLSPFKAAYYSIFSMLIVYLIAKRDFSLDFVKKIFRSIVEGTYDTVSIAIACAASGIVIGIITLTGVGAKLSNLIITISNGQLLIALVLTMITGIILGMGLPTTAAYLVLASVVAPGLVEMGLSQITAHMFVFFYGCISTITPPVALASYVAAGIAGADVGKVGWTAFLFGLPSYVLPFMFAYGPSLLMQGTAVEIITNLIGGIIGIYAIAASIVGYYKVDLPMAYRIPMFVAGILLIDQGYVTDIIGIAALALLYGLIVLRMRKEKGANV
ncbi:MAG TPA: TRAP transporter fused permease subunit, partial [Bacillota bacterium]|nr:TRAP transporter fused permease subunit [Bacillota bacterium]